MNKNGKVKIELETSFCQKETSFRTRKRFHPAGKEFPSRTVRVSSFAYGNVLGTVGVSTFPAT